MRRPLDHIRKLCHGHSVPLVIAGDVFDRWNPPPELINWAIHHLRMPHGVYAVPGQHDLPNHRYEDIRKSAYWTLVECGVIQDLHADEVTQISGLAMHGFPWHYPIQPCQCPRNKSAVHLAVVHDYCWCEGHSFPGCDESKHVVQHYKQLNGYDAAVFGDNHRGFLWRPKDPTLPQILNCGGLMRRNSDQKSYCPQIGVLWSNGKVDAHALDCHQDRHLDDEPGVKEEADKTMAEFVKVLEGLGELTSDFRECCKRFMDAKKVSTPVQRVVLSCLENLP